MYTRLSRRLRGSSFLGFKGILVYKFADTSGRDLEGLNIDGSAVGNGKHVLQREHLLAGGCKWKVSVTSTVLAVPS
jgi:hypothetical protein